MAFVYLLYNSQRVINFLIIMPAVKFNYRCMLVLNSLFDVDFYIFVSK
jgi:hypothetical protein